MKNTKTLILITAVVVVFIFILGNYYKKDDNISIKTINPRKTTVYNYVYATGNIEENDKSKISLDKNAIVLEQFFYQGDKVKKGDLILTVKTTDNKITENEIISTFLEENLSFVINAENDEILQIKSLVDGTILTAPNGASSTIYKNIPFLSVTNYSDFIAKIPVNEKYINQIEIGQSVSLTGETLSNTIKGEIYKIMPKARKTFNVLDNSSDVFIDVIVKINNDKPLITGASAKAKITTKVKKNALVVPYECILQDADGEFVVLLENNILSKKYITTASELDDEVEVTQGISENDIIVCDVEYLEEYYE